MGTLYCSPRLGLSLHSRSPTFGVSMNGLEFLEKMASHLAWPIAALLIAHQFREEIRQFLRRIRNAKYGGVEVSLGQEIQQITKRRPIAC